MYYNISNYSFNNCSCCRPEQCLKERLPETMVLLNNLVFLAQILKNYLELNQIEVLCHLMECSITAIVPQKRGIDIQEESGNVDDLDDLPEEMSSVIKRLSDSVASFVECKLSQSLENSTEARWHKEVQVIIIYLCYVLLE